MVPIIVRLTQALYRYKHSHSHSEAALKAYALILVMMLSPLHAHAQKRLPIIDMHLHASAPESQGPPPLGMCTPIASMPVWDPGGSYAAVFLAMFKKPTCPDPIWSPETDAEMQRRTLGMLEKHNVIGVLSPDKDAYMVAWRKASPARIIPSRMPDPLKIDATEVTRIKALKASGDIRVLGEMGTQYAGIAPDDPRLDAFWTMAENLDLPVGIHVGTGPPGTPYLSDSLKNYRGRLHSALSMEEVLTKHPKLRVYLMHAGYPMLDDLLTALYTHPQLYIDIGVIVYTQPRPAFYRYLQAIIDAGFGNRVMFGSDNMIWPESIERAIRVIEEAPFLDDHQKRDIFYNNAARFLRLSDAEISRHHQQ